MSEVPLKVEQIVTHWVTDSDKDFETMLHLFESKDYSWSLFVGHLVVEKLLKALIVKVTSNHAPFTHDLRRLASQSGIKLSDEKKPMLDTITTFNFNTRYDDYKQAFYKKCTKDFTFL